MKRINLRRIPPRRTLTAVLTLVAASALLASPALAQEAPRLGVYNPQQVLANFGPHDEFQKTVRDIQVQAQGQGEQIGQQAIMELQQEIESARNDLLQRYDAALNEVLPDVARQHELDVVVVEVAYVSGDIEPVDLTDELARAVNDTEAADTSTALPQQPGTLPGQTPQRVPGQNPGSAPPARR